MRLRKRVGHENSRMNDFLINQTYSYLTMQILADGGSDRKQQTLRYSSKQKIVVDAGRSMTKFANYMGVMSSTNRLARHQDLEYKLYVPMTRQSLTDKNLADRKMKFQELLSDIRHSSLGLSALSQNEKHFIRYKKLIVETTAGFVKILLKRSQTCTQNFQRHSWF